MALLKKINTSTTRIRSFTIEPKDVSGTSLPATLGNVIVVRDRYSIRIVPLANIIYCQADGSYTTIHIDGGEKILTSISLKKLESKFTANDFYRIHQSFCVALKNIEFIHKNHVELFDKTRLPLSRRSGYELRKLFEFHL
jgi:two-component system LytT family response regulator